MHLTKEYLMRRFYLILLLCLLSVTASAIDVLQISNITDRNGLSQNTIRCMMQDSKGFMWMGTINGLNRYNGKEFIVVHPQAELSLSIPDNRIRSITEDKNGYIWIRTFSSTLLCYDSRLEKFIDYEPENKAKIFSNLMIASNGDVWLWGKQGCCRLRYKDDKLNTWRPCAKNQQYLSVSFVFEDSQSRIWIGNQEELLLIEDDSVIQMRERYFYNAHEYKGQLFFIANGYISVFSNKQNSFLPDIVIPNDSSASVQRSCLLNNGLIMIANSSGIYTLDTQSMSITMADQLFRGKKLQNASFYTDNKGHIWVYNMSGILWRHHPDNTFEPLELIPSSILSLITQERYQVYQDSRDIIWITTFGNGLFAIDPDGRIFHYTSEKDLATNYLLCITEDNSGEIWLGTEFSGVTKISLASYPFDVFYPTSQGDGDRNNAVRMIYEDKEGYYWFGTRDGNIHVYDSLLRSSFTYRMNGGLPFTVAEDTLGYKWVGTKGGGLLVFPPKEDHKPQIYHLQDHPRQTSSSDNIFTIMRDSKERMWISSFGGGLHLAEHRNGQLTFRQFLLEKDQQNMMRAMIQDQTGLIWVGSNDGVIVFNPDEFIKDETNYTNLYPDIENQQSFNSNEVRVVYEDSHGHIWLGSTGGGLYLLIKKEPLKKSLFKHYNSDNGLSNEMVQAIQEDNEGNIWVSTESGISKFNPKTERFENFMFSGNRRYAAIFNELSTWKKKNGELMFGSYNGVYIFNPAEVTYDTYTPSVLITELRINGNSVSPGGQESPLKESITTTKRIVLKYNQNSFNLECTMLNLQAPELNQYVYFLEGYEKEWNPISRNNIATYRNVPPGSYVFKVKGCNSNGVWNEQETTLEIVILAPWWKTGWAVIFYIIIIAIIFFFVTKLMLRMHRLNMAVEVEKQLTEYKLRFFTNISHEFRTPLTIIRGAIESLDSQDNLSPSASKQLKILTKSSTRLLRLIDQLLEFRRLQNDKMELNLEPTHPDSFFYDIYTTFKEMAEKKNIEFLFEPSNCKVQLLLDRSKMDKVAYNLLSNAFKHTPSGGKIIMKLEISTTEDLFKLSISDSGKGVPIAQRDNLFVRFKQINYASDGTGVGLHLTSELVKVHKGNVIYIDSELGGACFLVSIPLSDNNYDEADIISNKTMEVVASTESIPEKSSEESIISTSDNDLIKEYRVMVVEDDEEVLGFVEEQLNKYFVVSTAVNGSDALKQIAEEQPDIVVCDVMMPRMDGFEFTQRLRSNFETSHIPVILLTAYSSEEHQLKGIESGADAYITKPFSIKYLLARITKLLETRERLRRRFNTEPGLVQSSVTFTDRDKVFLDKVHELIEQNISNTDFRVENFAQALGMGRSSLFRKMKGATGYSPNEYVRIIRMKKTAELLMNTDLNVSEISYQVGIGDPFYLSKCFKAQFGKSPSQYRKRDIKEE